MIAITATFGLKTFLTDIGLNYIKYNIETLANILAYDQQQF